MAKKFSDMKNLLETLSEMTRSDRKSTSIWLSESLFKDFQKACGNVSSSQVLELLMTQFINDINEQEPHSKHK